MATVSEKNQDTQLVVFQLGNELLGLDIASVKEIVIWQPITRVPQAPEFVEGIINLRGRLIPIIDLRKWFGTTQSAKESETRIVVVERASQIVGLVVDGVSEVLRISADRIEPAGTVLSGMQTDVVQGIVKTDSRLVILLDADALMKTEGIAGVASLAAARANGGEAANA